MLMKRVGLQFNVSLADVDLHITSKWHENFQRSAFIVLQKKKIGHCEICYVVSELVHAIDHYYIKGVNQHCGDAA